MIIKKFLIFLSKALGEEKLIFCKSVHFCTSIRKMCLANLGKIMTNETKAFDYKMQYHFGCMVIYNEQR